MTAIEKMVDWLVNDLNMVCRTPQGQIVIQECLKEARRLAAEEKSKPAPVEAKGTYHDVEDFFNDEPIKEGIINVDINNGELVKANNVGRSLTNDEAKGVHEFVMSHMKATAEGSLVEELWAILRKDDIGCENELRGLIINCLCHFRPASPAVEVLVREIKALRDSRYCAALDYAKRTECLGWEYKSKNGLFGVAEFKAHEKVNTLLGEHKGLHEALEIIAKYDNAKGR